MVAKVAGGIIGVGLISTGGIAMTKPHWLGMDYMPKWHSLAEDNGFSTETYSTGKFGEKYKNYLVGSTHKKDNTKETNQAWWEWAYRRLKASTPSENGKFSLKGTPKVTDAYSTDSNKTTVLNQICKDAFSKEDATGFGTGSDQFSKDEVWKYCSPGKLTTTSEDTVNDAYGDNTIGGRDDNKSKLVSVKDSSNDWFWEIRNKDFWSKDANNNWSGQKAAGDKNTSIFKKEYEENSSGGTGSNKQTIKDLCKEAYSKDKGNGDNKNNTDALKFCVLEAS